MSHADKTIVHLTDNGPTRMTPLGKAVKCAFISQVVRKLKESGKVKVEGNRNGIVYLPGQDITKLQADSAPVARKAKKAKGGKAKRSPAKRLKADTVEDFIAAFTADARLVLIDGEQRTVFTPAKTEKIATLLFAHFNE